jgi:hypothetical protein
MKMAQPEDQFHNYRAIASPAAKLPSPLVQVHPVEEPETPEIEVTPAEESLPPPPPGPRPNRPGGAVIAGQTHMATPIQIDQTQLPTNVQVKAAAEKKAVTIQDLDVRYEKMSFMSPLEIVYYKLLRAALKQYLIFPRVGSRSIVKAASDRPEHQKIAENVINGTAVSFVVCDVRLNIRAVVEVVDENQTVSNKDKARDYILKKAGCLLVRFYSGDKIPDVETVRLQIIGQV